MGLGKPDRTQEGLGNERTEGTLMTSVTLKLLLLSASERYRTEKVPQKVPEGDNKNTLPHHLYII